MKCWLFGAGEWGSLCLEQVKSKYDVKGYIDNKTWGGYKVNEIEVYSYKDFLKIFSRDERIIISCSDVDNIVLQLHKSGLVGFLDAVFNGKSLVRYEDLWNVVSTSQLGEEIGVKHWYNCVGRFSDGYKGIYVDVGAFHPFLYSNTRWAYEQGWKGINIDANKRSIDLFNIFRPGDININCGVSDENSELTFYYHEGADNTFCGEPNIEYKEKMVVPVKTLNTILEENHIKKIDFLDIDIEGFDEKVALSFDWEKYSPQCVLIEMHRSWGKLEDLLNKSKIHKKLVQEGYHLIAFYIVTALYVKELPKE